MTATDPADGHVEVAYLPFLDATNTDLAGFPDYATAAVDPAAVWVVPAPIDIDDPLSILRLYTFDLEWLILPETHKDREGYTFANVSYYALDDADLAMSEEFAGVNRTTVSAGFVRQAAGIAHSVWPLLSESIISGPARHTVVDLDPVAVLTGTRTVTDEEFLAIIRLYPRVLGMNPERADGEGTDLEYLLFADMVRFAWVHEWVHGFAGHVGALTARLGVSTLDERHAAGDEADVVLRRAFEFEADAIASRILLTTIGLGEDTPGALVEFQGGYAGRVAMLVMAVAFMATHWSEIERSRPDGLRGHPDAALRLLRMWDTAEEHLIETGRPEQDVPAFTSTAASAIFELAKTLPPFTAMEAVVPVVVETPQMERYRREMAVYHDMLAELDATLDRHEMDESVRGAIPRVVPIA